MENAVIYIGSEKETERFGIKLGREARAGDVIALIGDLGTGKTTLTRAIAEGLGVREAVISPTFNIVREYRTGRLPLYHFDAYRLRGPEEMYELGYEEYFFGDGLCVVEWADVIGEIIPDGAAVISIARGGSEEKRIYRIDRAGHMGI